MVKQLTNKTVYKVTYEGNLFLVTIQNLRNTLEGCPRMQANIINLSTFGDVKTQSYTYNFRCDYSGDYAQCKKIVEYHYNKEYKGA